MTEDKKYEDPELEKFVRDNKEMLEKFLAQEKSLFKETMTSEREKAERLIEDQSAKAKEAALGVVSMFADPVVQKHFMAVGMELLLGVDAMLKAAPLPDNVKEAMDTAKSMGDDTLDNARKTAAKYKASQPKKIVLDEDDEE